MDHFPNFRGENKKYLKPPPSHVSGSICVGVVVASTLPPYLGWHSGCWVRGTHQRFGRGFHITSTTTNGNGKLDSGWGTPRLPTKKTVASRWLWHAFSTCGPPPQTKPKTTTFLAQDANPGCNLRANLNDHQFVLLKLPQQTQLVDWMYFTTYFPWPLVKRTHPFYSTKQLRLWDASAAETPGWIFWICLFSFVTLLVLDV